MALLYLPFDSLRINLVISVSIETTLKKGKYHIIPCTFEANKESSFVIRTSYGKLKAISSWNYERVDGEWEGRSAGGCKNNKSFKYNPQYLIRVEEETPVSITVSHEEDDFDSVGLYVYKAENGKKLEKFLPKDLVEKAQFVDDEDESTAHIASLEPGVYSVIPCTFSPEKEGKFKVLFYSKKKISLIDEDKQQDESSSEAEEDQDLADDTPSTPTGSSTDLVKEKKKHMETIKELNEMREELSTSKETIRTLNSKIEALTGGTSKGSDSFTIPGSLLKEFVEQLSSIHKTNEPLAKKNKDWEKEKEKTISILKKVEAMFPSNDAQAGGDSTSQEWKQTVGEVVGNEVALYGSWKGASAGGCMNYTTWRNNPQIFLTVPSASTKVSITLTQEEKNGTTQIGLYLINPEAAKGKQVLFLEEGESDIASKSRFSSSRTNKLELTLPKTGKYPYVLIPCTFKAGEERNWTLTISSDEEIRAEPLSKRHEWNLSTLKDEWTDGSAGGCKNHATFVDNPQYLIRVEDDDSILRLLLLQHELEEFDTISTYLIKTQDGDGKQVKLSKVDNKDIVVKGEFGSDTESYLVTPKLKKGNYVVIPCTFDKGKKAPYELKVFSNDKFKVEELSSAETAVVQGEWKGKTAGGCLNDIVTFKNNQQFLLTIKKDLELVFKLQQQPLDPSAGLSAIGYYIFKSNGKRKFKVRKDDTIDKGGFTKTKELVVEHTLKAADSPFIVVPCTLNPNEESSFKLSIASKKADVDFSNDLSFGPAPEVYKELNASSAWDEHHSGGCLNYTTWMNNPQFLFTTDKKTEVVVYLSTGLKDEELKAFSGIGFYVVRTDPASGYRLELNPKDILKKASFRKAQQVMIRFQADPGSYNIIASTFRPGYYTSFDVTVFSDNIDGSTLTALDNADVTFDGQWDSKTAGGNTSNYEKWITNPRYYITVKKPVKLGLTLVQTQDKDDSAAYQAIGFTVTPTDGEGNPRTSKSTDLIAVAGFEAERDISAVFELEPSLDPYVVIPSTFDADIHLPYRLSLQFDPANAEFIDFVDKVPQSLDGDEDQFKAEVLLSKLQKCINSTSLSSIDLINLIDKAGLTFLSPTAQELQQIVHKLQTVLNALKAPELFSSDHALPEDEATEVTEVTTPGSTPPAPPPPPPEGGPSPPPPPPPSTNTTTSTSTGTSSASSGGIDSESIKKGVTLKKTTPGQERKAPSNPQEEMLDIIKSGRAQLKSAANRKLKEKPVEKDLFCSFNMEMLSRRRAFEDEEDKEEDDDDDWD